METRVMTTPPDTLPCSARFQIPIIDASSLWSPDFQERLQLAGQVREACINVEFFYIKNHGVTEPLITALHGAAHGFFCPSRGDKKEIFNDKKFRGYVPFNAESSTGSDLDSPSSTGSLSEAFDIGYELAADPEHFNEKSLPLDTYSLYGDNVWPDVKLPAFREIYMEYSAAALTLSRRLMRNFSLALDLEETFFDSKIDYPGAFSRILHYPAQPLDGQTVDGMGAHTDTDCFTILSQDCVPALQVRNVNGEWTVVPPIPGTLVVNIADSLSKKTFKSTIHRVTNLTGQDRYSIPFFFGPPRSAPFKAGEWVSDKLSKGYPAYEVDE
ncbi:Clavaminate synthase-like protein [Aspergillus venezuelensis]